jgi:hypothetical protein
LEYQSKLLTFLVIYCFILNLEVKEVNEHGTRWGPYAGGTNVDIPNIKWTKKAA